MKTILTALLAIIVLLSGCSINRDISEKFSGDDAIAKVVREQNKSEYPAKAGRIKGTIHGGGPAPGLMIPGEFESSATRRGNNVYFVTLTQYWSAKDFRVNTNSTNQTLSHYWKYEVTPAGVKLMKDDGDFSPEFIE